MAKMTKAQARKRLNEASVKMMNVYAAGLEGKLGAIPMADFKKLNVLALDLRKIVEKMR